MSIMGEDKLLRFDDLGLLMDKVSYEYVKANSTLDTNTDVVTPYNVAKTMVESLCTWTKGEIFTDPNAKFLDIYCKSGIYLGLIYNELMLGLIDVIPDTVKRSEHIINNMLYGACPCELSALISRKTAYGNMLTSGNIGIINNYIGLSTTDRALSIKKEFNRMKFDVVIGNPPYNRGIDIDFVNLGYELSTKYCCMITPAKWQTGVTDSSLASKSINYEQFRKKIVPHMSHVVFYPNSADVFDIRGNTGISYFLVDRDIHDKCSVENRFSSFPEIYNGIESRTLLDGITLCNFGKHVIDYIDYSNGVFEYIRKNESKKNWVVWGTAAMPMFLDYKPGSNTPHYMLSDLKIADPKTLKLSNDSFIFFESDSKQECESFVSYLYTRLVRFLISCNIGLYKGWNKPSTFKYVPAPTVLDANGNRVPGKFDHIYTDEELYKTFNIPQEYIDAIGVVIKERK